MLKPGTHASTFGGNHLACAAGNAVMEALLQPGFFDHVNARSKQLKQGLEKIFSGHYRDIRGQGLLLGVAMYQAPGPLMTAALHHGLVCGTAGDQVLRLAPPLTLSESEADELLERLAAAWASC